MSRGYLLVRVEGRFFGLPLSRVLEVVPLSGHDERELLERLVALEARSEHPLAAAIRD